MEIQFLKEQLKPGPKIFMPLAEAKKIWAHALQVPGEINGLGLIDRKKNNFWLTETFILKQKVSQASATINPLAFNRYVAECEDPSRIRFQWHSHGDISADFFSGKDIHDTIAKWTGDYLISLVLNKSGEYRCRLDIFEPVYLGFEIPLLIVVPIEEDVLQRCWNEIEEKVEDGGGLLRRAFKRKKQKPVLDQKEKPLALPLSNFRSLVGEEKKNG